MNAVAGDCIFGSALRSNAALKFAAVTGCPFENFVKPVRTVKSYVFPLFEAAAGFPRVSVSCQVVKRGRRGEVDAAS
jgi:hypothetical protein